MDCSPNHCSSPRRVWTDRARRGPQLAARIAALCGVGLLSAACGQVGERRVAAGDPPTPAMPGADAALCVPSDEGFLRARLQGSIEADIDWSGDVPQCRGGLRPSGDGVRLLFKGPGATPGEALLIVIGIGPLRPGESKHQVPANLTLVREGAGEFFATQGDDKCALDEVRQQPVPGTALFRLSARGYCTQPARAVRGDGAVLVPTFDVEAVVDFAEAAPESTFARSGK